MRASYSPVGAAGGRSGRTPSFWRDALTGGGGGGGGDDEDGGRGGFGESDVQRALASARSAASGGYGTTLSGAVGGGAVYKGLYSSVTLDGARERRADLACPCLCGRVSVRLCVLLSLGALLGSLLLGGLLGFYVGAPSFVRDRITASKLVFDALELSAPVTEGDAPLGAAPLSPQQLQQLQQRWQRDASWAASSAGALDGAGAAAAGTWGFTLSVRGVLSDLSPIGGTLAPFHATMLHGGATVATFDMPEISAQAGVDNAVAFSAPVTLVSLAAFSAFGAELVNGASVDVTLRGRTSVSTSVLGVRVVVANVDFEKTVAVAGARGLPGATVSRFSLSRSNATAAVADLEVSVVNPSVASILPLGDVALRLLFEGADVGSAQARNASLFGGGATNNLTLQGFISSSNASAAGRLISDYLGGRVVSIVAVGDGSSSALYAPVVSALRLQASLAGSTDPLIAGLAVIGMYLRPMGAESVGIDLNVSVSVLNPLGAASPIVVRAVGLNCTLLGEGSTLGDLFVPLTPVLDGRLISSGGDGYAVGDGVGADDDGGGGGGGALQNLTLALSATLSLATTNARFSAFVLSFLQRSSVDLGLVSNASNAMTIDISCALGNLQVAIPLGVSTAVPGIGGFPEVALQGFAVAGLRDLPVPAILASLNVSLFNPSPATFPLGASTTLGIYAGGQRLGETVILNGTLYPGANLLSLVGVLTPPPAALPQAAALFSKYLAGVNSSVTVVGENATMPGGTATPAWLLGAVQNISLAATLPGLPAAQAAGLLANLTVANLGLDFGALGELAAPLVAGSVLAVLRLPFSVAATVQDLDLNLSFVEVGSGTRMAALSILGQGATWLPCNTSAACDAILLQQVALLGGADACSRPAAGSLGTGAGAGAADDASGLVPVGVLAMTLAPTPLVVADAAAFSRLLNSVLSQTTVSITLAGTASPRVGLNIGTLALTGVAIAQTVELSGMGGFLNPPVVVTQGELYNTSRTGVDLFVNFNLTNPAAITGRLGPITLAIDYAGASFISATIAPLVVNRGVNERVAAGRFQPADAALDPTSNALAREALSRYLRGIDTPVIVRGGPASSPNPLIAAALVGFSTAAVFPGNPVPLIRNGTLFLAGQYVRPSDNKTFVPGVLFSDNTLAVNLQIVNASLVVYLCAGQTSSTECTNGVYTDAIGFFSEAGDLQARPIFVPAKTVSASAPYNITLLASTADDLTIGVDDLLFGNILGKMSGNLTTALSSVNGSEPFALECFYEQELLPLYAVL